ncbi:NAC transcription factor NAM-1 [Setaria italica]|uniref:NAC transcription factor NAM-1 n=1 Tax=Setaria italica TaxID=4555 RepID=UPI000350DD4C|nr:NAC transcription factor NAM-1 [Setaria italica]
MAFSLRIASAASIQHQPGFRFTPTDEEIVVHYLRPRAVNEPIPSAVIADVQIMNHNPWDLLTGHPHIFKSFFHKKQIRILYLLMSSNVYCAPAPNTEGSSESTVIGGVPLMIGLKRTLVFHLGKSDIGENTEWAMQEYSLAGASLTPYHVMRPSTIFTKKNDSPSEALSSVKVPVMVYPDKSWVVCRMYKKRKHTPGAVANVYSTAEGGQVPFYNFLAQGNSIGTASSSSRTNISLEGAKDGEEVREGSNVKANTSEVGK